jgi:Mrp family chromosome partitioning ATPase
VLVIENASGLTDVIRSRTSELPSVTISHYLSVLTAGRVDTGLLAQLASESMKAAVDYAATQFDWVLLDTPPVGLLPDAQLVARICEAVLFVVGAGVSPYDFVQRSIATLGADRILGVVLNRVDAQTVPHGDYYYGHHYPPLR